MPAFQPSENPPPPLFTGSRIQIERPEIGAAVDRLNSRGLRRLYTALFLTLLFILISIVHHAFPEIDRLAARWVSARAAHRGYDFFEFITHLGNIRLILPVSLGLLAILLVKSRYESAIHLVFSILGGASFGTLLKVIFSAGSGGPQNSLPTGLDLGFPSGHALMGVLFFGWAAGQFTQTVTGDFWKGAVNAAGAAIIFLIGISRLMVGVHFPSDVLAGWTVGAFWLCISFPISKYLHQTIFGFR